jgi:tetratricopeptide (TPR) repeat protein
MVTASLKEFSKRASMVYELSAAHGNPKKGSTASRDPYKALLLKRALSEARQLCETPVAYSESSTLEYAMALLELSRTFAIHNDTDKVEELYRKLPKEPRSDELDFINAEMAYVLADLLVKEGSLEKAASIFDDLFPGGSSFGAELIRLDLADLLVSNYLENDGLAKAKSLFFSYMPDNQAHPSLPYPADKHDYAREEYSRILAKMGESILKYSKERHDNETLMEIIVKLENFDGYDSTPRM